MRVGSNEGNCPNDIRINKFHFIEKLFFFFSTLSTIESDESPGMYLRDDFLGGPTELRAPTAERAALFLDAALAGRTSSIYEPALIFTLHVYQYSLAGKGGGEWPIHRNVFTQILIKLCLFRQWPEGEVVYISLIWVGVLIEVAVCHSRLSGMLFYQF